MNKAHQKQASMTQRAAHTVFWHTSDFMIVVTLVTGFALNYLFPIHLPIAASATHPLIFGAVFIAIGIAFIFPAKKEFNKEHQPSAPGKPTTKIVTTGVFKISRNPLYLGIMIAIAGIGFVFSNMWILILGIFLAMSIHIILILPEEKYLIETFGKEYIAYMDRVRRWI